MSNVEIEITNTSILSAGSFEGHKQRLIEESLTAEKSNGVEQKKQQVVSREKRNIIVYHIFCSNSQHIEIVENQVSKLVKSGVYEWCDDVYVTCIDSEGKWNGIDKIFNGLSKVQITKLKENTFEYPAIHKAYKLSQQYDGYLLYMHSKGATASKATFEPGSEASPWKTASNTFFRNLTEHFLIENYKECVSALDRGYNLISVDGFQALSNRIYNMRPRKDPAAYILPNFYWTKMSFMRDAPAGEPESPSKIANDRYYYMRWITSQRDGRDIKHMGYFPCSWFSQLTYLPAIAYKDPDWLMSPKKDFKIESIWCTSALGVQIYAWDPIGPAHVDVTVPVLNTFYDNNNAILHITTDFEQKLIEAGAIKKMPRRVGSQHRYLIINCLIGGSRFKITLRNHWGDGELVMRLPNKHLKSHG